jgi:uncharacterized membrane protein YheB (UPF0754 family)
MSTTSIVVRAFGRRLSSQKKKMHSYYHPFNNNNNVNKCNYDIISKRIMIQYRQSTTSTTIINNATRLSPMIIKQSTNTSTPTTSIWYRMYNEITKRPIEYATIPVVAAFVGISTNWMGVKMLFYPIEYIGTSIEFFYQRPPHTPYGFFGWQGVVPTKTEPMAQRLVNIITQRLFSLEEAFRRLDPIITSQLLSPIVQDMIQQDCGTHWSIVLQPILPYILSQILIALQKEITTVLDIDTLVLNAFVRDKEVLVDLFQKVGRVELKFLVESGFGFGALLGIGQMVVWAVTPQAWTLPVAGAFVGYITNWIAIKLLFEPADPIPIGPFIMQGLFESRQVEVSNEFGNFLDQRVLQSYSVLNELVKDGDDGLFYDFLRRQLPFPIPTHILSAAIKAIQKAADEPELYPELHRYITKQLDISETLASRLKELPPKQFEDLLHPVFQEDEIILIATGGVLGFAAGLVQTQIGWGGPNAIRNSILLIISSLAASAAFFLNNDGAPADEKDVPEDVIDIVLVPPMLLRRNTILRQRE